MGAAFFDSLVDRVEVQFLDSAFGVAAARAGPAARRNRRPVETDQVPETRWFRMALDLGFPVLEK